MATYCTGIQGRKLTTVEAPLLLKEFENGNRFYKSEDGERWTEITQDEYVEISCKILGI